ncbi:MAG TPA: hypothetical protein VJ385_07295 [Fibrobacteria bacterium]|nr:hypothetical protein [Fibrobacteria bacterium]
MGFRDAIPALALAGLLGIGCRGPGPVPSEIPRDPLEATVPPGLPRASPALEDCRYAAARAMVERYCADCHGALGRNPSRERAHRILGIDTYADWMAASRAVPGRVDKDSLEGRIMPPPSFPRQPSDAERRMLVEWVKRGSPNTPDGR